MAVMFLKPGGLFAATEIGPLLLRRFKKRV
jgi:hypothetical protein